MSIAAPRRKTAIPRVNFRLKDGREGLIRAARLSDAAGLHECRRAVHRVGEGVLRTVSELGRTPKEFLRTRMGERLKVARAGRRGALLICEVDGRIVGEGFIRRMAPSRVRHVAHLGLAVHPQYQGLGVGRALMSAMIGWARSVRSGPDGPVLRVDLDVFAVNTRAIRLYKSLGFRIEGTRKRFIRFEDGSFSDDHVMALSLE